MILDKDQLIELCEVAKLAALEAGAFINASRDTNYEKLEDKKGLSEASKIVTEVDLKSQEIILKHLTSSCSKYDLGLLTEEKEDDQSRLEKDYFWSIDPLDGTLEFTKGNSGYAVSIALVSKEGESVIGVVAIPTTQDIYTSIKGNGVLKNGTAFTANPKASPVLKVFADQSLKTGSGYNEALSKLNNVVKSMGCNEGFEISFGNGAVANAIEVMNNSCACYFKFPKSKIGGGCIWDFAATNLFFNELGLTASDIDGNPIELNNNVSIYMNHCGILFATNSEITQLIKKMN